MSEQITGIRPASMSDAGELAIILADAFSDDPILLWGLGKPDPLRRFFELMAKNIYLNHDISQIDESGQGGTLWLPNGASNDPKIGAMLTMGSHLLRSCGFAATKRLLGLGDFVGKMHPKKPHHYLFAIGVRQSGQGKGLGSKLFVPGLERCDRENMPAYLENSKEKNLGFYRAHGFEVMDKVQPAPDSPPMWPMWREPRS